MLNKREVRRYLGIKSGDGGVSDALIERLYGLASARFAPRLISGEYDIEKREDGYALTGTDVVFKGKLIEKVLNGCSGLVLFALTLTLESDKMLREFSAKDMTQAVVLNAVLTDYIENAANEFEAKVKAEQSSAGKGARPRISCGYGDFDLAAQRDIITLLKADKYLGITVNESNMLTPVKSVTALIGIGGAASRKATPCESCANDCEYRKDTK